MRKKVLFAIAGAGLLLAGCKSDYIMGDHRYQTIPVDNAPGTGIQAPVSAADNTAVPVPADTPAPAVSRIKYAPMTDAVPTGGVDSAPKQRKKGASGKVAAGGVYVVQRGDTPERIARKNKVRLSALMTANNLTEESARRLQVGQKLTIPAGTTAVKANTADKKAAASKKPAAALENGKYKVQRGDSPERIARRFKVKLKDLLAANNLTEDSARRLQIGQVLTIPGRDGAAPAPAPAPVELKKKPAPADNKPAPADNKPAPADNKPAPAPAPADQMSVVQSDADNFVLWEATENTTYAAVAAKYGISEAKLRNINAASDTQQIQKGDLIFVPQK